MYPKDIIEARLADFCGDSFPGPANTARGTCVAYGTFIYGQSFIAESDHIGGFKFAVGTVLSTES